MTSSERLRSHVVLHFHHHGSTAEAPAARRSPAAPPELLAHGLEVGPDHARHELPERALRLPPQLFARLRRVPEQGVDLGGPEVARVDLHPHLAGPRVPALLLDPLPLPHEVDAHLLEGELDELAHRVGFTRRQHVIARPVVVDDAPHAVHVVAGVAPVAPGVQVPEVDAALQPVDDGGDGPGDLAGHEGLAPRRPFVVERDAVRGMDAVRLAIVDRDPIGVRLGRRVWTRGTKRRGLVLGRHRGVSVQLRGRCLVEADLPGPVQDAQRLQQAQGAQRVGVRGVLRRLEAHLHVALGGEVVDLVRPDLLNQPDQVGRVGQVSVVQEEPPAGFMGVLVQVVDTCGVEGRGAPLHPVHHVALAEQQLREVRAVLPRHPRDQRHAARHGAPRACWRSGSTRP